MYRSRPSAQRLQTTARDLYFMLRARPQPSLRLFLSQTERHRLVRRYRGWNFRQIRPQKAPLSHCCPSGCRAWASADDAQCWGCKECHPGCWLCLYWLSCGSEKVSFYFWGTFSQNSPSGVQVTSQYTTTAGDECTLVFHAQGETAAKPPPVSEPN